MTFDSILKLFGGLALFLYGMHMMSSGLEGAAGRSYENHSGKTDQQPFSGRYRGSGHHSSNPELLCHYRYGCRLCEFTADDIESGSLDHHGCQYRYDDHRTADCPGCIQDRTACGYLRCCHWSRFSKARRSMPSARSLPVLVSYSSVWI